jgi:hypothetical protein
MNTTPNLTLAAICLSAVMATAIAGGAVAQGGSIRLNLKTAAGATELPVGPWGPYSTKHLAPCYLGSRRVSPLFSFPIVVGQQRDEILSIGSKTAAGKTRLRPERVTLFRRSAGLSPAVVSGDAAGPVPIARIIDSDSDGFVTSARIEFPKARLIQEVSGRRDANGAMMPAQDWPAGSALVRWSPAFAGADLEGLIVRISLTNTGATAQSYFVDLLGSLDRPDPLYTLSDLTAELDPDGRGIELKHKKVPTVFALAGQQGDYTTRCYGVTGAHFGPNADVFVKDVTGAPTPPEVPGAAELALLRTAGIMVEPGATRTLILCIGIGHDSDAALLAAKTLLSLSEDRKGGTAAAQESLCALADKLHEKSRYRSGSAAFDRLIAQSLVNTPFQDVRRVGVPSREGASRYTPGSGGWQALAWAGYRPDWSAAQLNAWFVTQTPAQKAIKSALAVPPTDILALWELFQRTHDRDMLERFYPYAVWRFRELIESGREREDDWLFTWPMARPVVPALAGKRILKNAVFDTEPAADPEPYYAPDYSAYVIVSAKVLLACAKALDKTAEEQATFTHVIDHACGAMNQTLWNAKKGLFEIRPVSSAGGATATLVSQAEMPRTNGIECLLPYVVGPELLAAAQDDVLHSQLTDETTFLSPIGLRSVSAKSAAYRANDPGSGGVRFGVQWMFWKALLDRGDTAGANLLASRVLSGYERAAEGDGGLPEWLNADTGKAGGRTDYTGDSCALIAMHEAYRRPGTVSCGWNVSILDDHFDAAADSLRVVFRSLVAAPKGALLCVLGKPNALYHVKGGITGDFKTDNNGCLTLSMPNDKTTQQIEIAPAGPTK